MFGSLTDKLAIVGACAVVFWIICWLILVSKNESLPGWVSSLATILGGLLSFCTAITTALFFIPIAILSHQAQEKARHEGFQEGLKIGQKLNSSDIEKYKNEGYEKASHYYNRILDKKTQRMNKVFLEYMSFYHRCRTNPELTEFMADIPEPDGYKNYLKYNKSLTSHTDKDEVSS